MIYILSLARILNYCGLVVKVEEYHSIQHGLESSKWKPFFLFIIIFILFFHYCIVFYIYLRYSLIEFFMLLKRNWAKNLVTRRKTQKKGNCWMWFIDGIGDSRHRIRSATVVEFLEFLYDGNTIDLIGGSVGVGSSSSGTFDVFHESCHFAFQLL